MNWVAAGVVAAAGAAEAADRAVDANERTSEGEVIFFCLMQNKK